MIEASFLLHGVAIPLGVSALLGVALLALARRGADGEGASLGWLAPVAVGAGYLAGHLALLGWPRSLRTTLTTEWLPLYAALLGVGLGLVEARWRWRHGLRWALRLAGSALLIGFMLRAKVLHAWSPGQAAGWIAASGVACGLSWLMLDVLRHSPPLPEGVAEGEGGPGAALGALAFSGLSAGVLLLGSSIKLGLLGGALAAAWGPLLLLAWLRPGLAVVRLGLPPLALVWQALVLRGVFYASLPALAGLLLVVAPFGLGIGVWPPVRRRAWWQGSLLGVLLLSLAAAGAGAWTWNVTAVQAADEVQTGPDYDSFYGGR